MKKLFKHIKKPSLWSIFFSIFLAAYSLFAVLDAFVIPSDVVSMSEAQASQTSAWAASSSDSSSDSSDKSSSDTSSDSSDESSSDAVVTDTTYDADGVKITITEETVDDTQVYIADIYLDDPSDLLSGLADDSFGRNISETISEIADEVNAVLAINGDYYGFRDTGYVMRNGYLYRDTASSDADQEDLGCTEAYNLDGGGSTTMVFNGNVINKPTTNGNTISERAVSDIIYIAG